MNGCSWAGCDEDDRMLRRRVKAALACPGRIPRARSPVNMVVDVAMHVVAVVMNLPTGVRQTTQRRNRNHNTKKIQKGRSTQKETAMLVAVVVAMEYV